MTFFCGLQYLSKSLLFQIAYESLYFHILIHWILLFVFAERGLTKHCWWSYVAESMQGASYISWWSYLCLVRFMRKLVILAMLVGLSNFLFECLVPFLLLSHAYKNFTSFVQPGLNNVFMICTVKFGTQISSKSCMTVEDFQGWWPELQHVTCLMFPWSPCWAFDFVNLSSLVLIS
jgi:hypothetical protein